MSVLQAFAGDWAWGEGGELQQLSRAGASRMDDFSFVSASESGRVSGLFWMVPSLEDDCSA